VQLVVFFSDLHSRCRDGSAAFTEISVSLEMCYRQGFMDVLCAVDKRDRRLSTFVVLFYG